MKRTLLIYIGVLLLCGVGMLVAFERGRHLQPPAAVEGAPIPVGVIAPAASGDSASPWSPLRENLKNPLSRLLLQVIVIVLATRMLGAIFTHDGRLSASGEDRAQHSRGEDDDNDLKQQPAERVFKVLAQWGPRRS